MAAKVLSFEEFIALAMKNYSRGGDGYVECWDERTFNDYVAECGPITRARAMEMFRESNEIYEDMMGW